MTINEKQDEIIEEFDLFDDLVDKTQYLIDLGKKLPPMSQADKIEENRIVGCLSNVWLTSKSQDGRVFFAGDGDENAQTSKGLISLLTRVLSGEKAEDIANADLYFIEKIGMRSFITSRRTGGLNSMIQRMKDYGRKHATATL